MSDETKKAKAGERGYDWEAIRDGELEIVIRYVDAAEIDKLGEANAEDATRQDWICRHVASPSEDVMIKRFARRPLLEKRCLQAILSLYGAAEADDMGKA